MRKATCLGTEQKVGGGLNMKRFISCIICIALIVVGCASPGGVVEDRNNDSNDGAYKKPTLEIMGEEEETLDKVVSTRTQKSDTAPEAGILRTLPYGDNPTTMSQQEQSESQASVPKDYTVMIYIIGSDLESKLGAATEDIQEMRDAGVDFDKTNLLLYAGGSRRWLSDIPNNVNSVLDLSKEDSWITAQTSESVDMGCPETLTEFINYCTTNYPAEHYSLILWDHGGGPLWGYGCDELFDNDSLVLDELRDAMKNTEFGPDRKLDWVGFDACLMGSLENAVLWKDYALYLVSSEEVEAGKGWDYHFLSTLNESQEPEEVVKSIVDSFGIFYEENQTSFFSPDATLSALDLSKTENLLEAVNLLFDVMNDGIENGDYYRINQARSRAKAFGIGAVSTLEETYDLIDLHDFVGQMGEMYPEECDRVADAVDQMVCYATSNVEGAGGISIYIPGYNKELYKASGALKGNSTTLSSQYDSFVKSYTDEWFSEEEFSLILPELQEENGQLTMYLTAEQEQHVSRAYYTIMTRDDSYYTVAMADIPIEADDNGVFHIPDDPMLATVSSDTYESQMPWSCRQIEHKNETNTYSTVYSIICTANGFNDFNLDIDEEADIIFKNIAGENLTELQDVRFASGDIWSSGKESIDLSKYSGVVDLGAFGYEPVRLENGEMAPYYLWRYAAEHRNYRYHSDPVPVDSSFRFIMKPASAFDCTISCQLTVIDVHGGIHASECRDLPLKDKHEIVEEETENGVLQYELFADHAEVISYQGTDETVEIPSTVSGKAVTIIAPSSFYDEYYNDEGENYPANVVLPDTVTEIGTNAMMHNLQSIALPEGLKKIGTGALIGYQSSEIHIPDSVEFIGTGAFRDSKLEKVVLPSSLRKIGAIPFHDCSKLKEISINVNNSYYKTIDGVLYSADGKTLIQYPHGRGNNYKIEEGTETIAYGAFAENKYSTEVHIEHIEFPNTLKTIGNAAFYECDRLDGLLFPDSLEEIGALAFGCTVVSQPYRRIESVHLGANVKEIGGQPFTNLGIRGFDVDPANDRYDSFGGFITNKAKDTILIAPLGMDDAVIIPEGITTLPSKVFAQMGEGREYYIPDSVFRFAKDVFGDPEMENSHLSKIKIHCTEGSVAEAYAKKYNIPYDTNIEADSDADTDFESDVLSSVSDVSKPGSKGDGLEYTEEKETRERITATWHIYEDHAELLQIVSEYDSGIYEIPAEYKGKPVTILGSKEEDIYGSEYAAINKLIIPASVETIYPYIIQYGLAGLETIVVEDRNTAYRSENGVLYTTDGALVLYPGEKKDEEFDIPDGTKEIKECAFSGFNSNLRKVKFPQSLTVIGSGAFIGCTELTEVEFNEGLKTIESDAFSMVPLRNISLPSSIEEIGDYVFEVSDGFGEIVLPDSLSSLGEYAFSTPYDDDTGFLQDHLRIPNKLKFEVDSMGKILLNNFVVDEDHPYHSTIDGLLLDKDGRTLISVPGQREGRLDVPEGVQIIQYGAFKDCRYLTDVYLPDSVTDVRDLGQDGYDEPCNYTVHCHEGSRAQKQLEENGVDWVKIE